jgi:hypothetical protein
LGTIASARSISGGRRQFFCRLDVNASLLRKQQSQLPARRECVFPEGNGHQNSREEENRRLQAVRETSPKGGGLLCGEGELKPDAIGNDGPATVQHNALAASSSGDHGWRRHRRSDSAHRPAKVTKQFQEVRAARRECKRRRSLAVIAATFDRWCSVCRPPEFEQILTFISA